MIPPTRNSQRRVACAGFGVAIFSFVCLGLAHVVTSCSPRGTSTTNRDESSLARIKRTKVLKAGYSGFKPYTIIDPNERDPNKKVTGFCVDLINEMAARQSPPWTIEWQPTTFESLKADMESGRFDVFADAVYQTVPRAAEFGFTDPFGYFGVAVALVRKDDSRFNKFSDLDRSDITIALAEGWTSTEYARRVLKKPKLKMVSVGDDPFIQLQDVIAGRADVALQDVPTVYQFAKAHSNEVKALWLDNPPTRVPAGFMTRHGEWDLISFLNTSLRALQADGTIEELDRKWSALNEFPAPATRLGLGLRAGQ